MIERHQFINRMERLRGPRTDLGKIDARDSRARTLSVTLPICRRRFSDPIHSPQDEDGKPRYFPRSGHSINAGLQHYHLARCPFVSVSKPDISPDLRWRIPMKTMILAAVAAISLSVGTAYAQGVPADFQEPHYGAQGS